MSEHNPSAYLASVLERSTVALFGSWEQHTNTEQKTLLRWLSGDERPPRYVLVTANAKEEPYLLFSDDKKELLTQAESELANIESNLRPLDICDLHRGQVAPLRMRLVADPFQRNEFLISDESELAEQLTVELS